jgi:serine/threonine protein kinase
LRNIIDEHKRSDTKFEADFIQSVMDHLIHGIKDLQLVGIIHGNIHPDHLLWNGNKIWFVDFGRSQFINIDKVYEFDSIRGPLEYLPPEVFQENQLYESSDLWSAGAILFEMITLITPGLEKLLNFKDYITSSDPLFMELLSSLLTEEPSIRKCDTIPSIRIA